MKIKAMAEKIGTKYVYGFFILILFFVLDLIYISNTSANIPTMDYWRYGQDFLHDIFNGGIRFNDFWKSINGQRAFLTYALFYINVKFFHWNTRVSMYFGAIVTFITGIMLICIIDKFKFSSDEKKDNFIKQILLIVVGLLLFNNIQWEIKLSEFYAPFSVVFLFCILNMWLADRILCDLTVETRKVFLYTVLLGLCICFVYSAFFPAVVGSICICGLIQLIINFKTQKLKYLNKYIIVGVGILTAAAIYMIGIEGIATENNFHSFLKSTVNGELIKSILVYLGSGIVHVVMIDEIGYSVVYCLGGVIALLYLFGIIIYFKNIKDIKSYFPLMLILYTLLTGVLISYGRGQVYGVEYMTTSRYAYQSKLGIIGLVWILGCFLNTANENKKKNVAKYILGAMVIIFISGAMLMAQKVENSWSPYRRVAYETWIGYMKNIDSCTSDELKNILANNEEEVRITVKYMKKYKLGIFYYNDNSDLEDSSDKKDE